MHKCPFDDDDDKVLIWNFLISVETDTLLDALTLAWNDKKKGLPSLTTVEIQQGSCN